MSSWGQRVDVARRRAHVARKAEEDRFAAFLSDPQRRLLWLEGMPGSGKTTLLSRFAALADGRTQVLRAATRAITREAWTGAFDPEAERLLVDDFHLLRDLLPFFANTLLPALGDHQKLVVSSERPPPPELRQDPGWASLVTRCHVGRLSDEESDAVLSRAGVPPAARLGLSALADGHALALRLIGESWDGFDWAKLHDVRRAFLDRMLARVSPVERRVLEVAALNRVATPELLQAIGPDLAEAFHAVAELPVVRRVVGGLALAPVLCEPLAAELAFATPDLRDSLLRTSLRHAEAKTLVGPRERRVFWATNSAQLIGHALRRPLSAAYREVSGGRPRVEDFDAIVSGVRRILGEESSVLARRWLERAPRGAFVARDRGEVVAFVQFLERRRLTTEDERDDPAVAAFVRFADQQGASRARLARFYLPLDDAARGLPFVQQETTAQLLFGVDLELACSVQPDWFLTKYRELGAHPKVGRFSVDGEAWSLSAEDLRKYAPEDLHRIWSQLCQADPSLLSPAAAQTTGVAGVEDASKTLRRALRSFHDAGRLSRSPLAQSRPVRALVASGREPDTVRALRTVLREAVAELGSSGQDGWSRRVLEASYFGEPRKQLAIAQELGVGESTYRRHLKTALERLAQRWLAGPDQS